MKNIVLVGAGGTGVSSIGFLLSQLGYTNIIAIDSTCSQITEQLEKTSGITMISSHGVYNVQTGDQIIYSDACPNAPEVEAAHMLYTQEAREGRNIAHPPLSYFAFLGIISTYFNTIAVAGTHGKSTTTALLSYTLSQQDTMTGLCIMGALVPQLNNTNFRVNNSHTDDIQKIFQHIFTGKQADRDESLRKKYRFTIEADEFNRHFLCLDIDTTIILNAELDHSDIYENEEVYLDTFIELIARTKDEIFMITGEKGVEKIAERCAHEPHLAAKITYLPAPSDSDLAAIKLGHLFGDHNKKNALLVTAVLEKYSIDAGDTAMTFTGLRRRMEFLVTSSHGTHIYSDYGHHPSELQAVYQAMRQKFPHKKLHIIFQPHQARRILQFWEEFAATIAQRDGSYIYSLYTAREDIGTLLTSFPAPISTISSQTTSTQLGEIFASFCHTSYTENFSDIITYIMEHGENDVICLCSAGNLDYQTRQYIHTRGNS